MTSQSTNGSPIWSAWDMCGLSSASALRRSNLRWSASCHPAIRLTIILDRLNTGEQIGRAVTRFHGNGVHGGRRSLRRIRRTKQPDHIQIPPLARSRSTIIRGSAPTFSSELRCETCGIEYPEPEPQLFNFNRPLGACPECEGFGNIVTTDMDRVVPDPQKSLREGAIAPWNSPSYAHELEELLALANDYKLPRGCAVRRT